MGHDGYSSEKIMNYNLIHEIDMIDLLCDLCKKC